MSSWDFILREITYSYSSISGYDNCPHGFKLSYIDKKPRKKNFYSDFGNLVHDEMKNFFDGVMDTFELSQDYQDKFDKVVTSAPPPYPAGMREKYKEQGQFFFDNFSFGKEGYNVLLNEGTIEFTLPNGLKFTARPDLVLKDKITNENILFDYKTSAPFKINKKTHKETADNKKLEGYYKQMFIYTYATRSVLNIPVDIITLWFPRLDKMVDIYWSEIKENETLEWVTNQLNKIMGDEEWKPNLSKENEYFCFNLCSVLPHCKYR